MAEGNTTEFGKPAETKLHPLEDRLKLAIAPGTSVLGLVDPKNFDPSFVKALKLDPAKSSVTEKDLEQVVAATFGITLKTADQLATLFSFSTMSPDQIKTMLTAITQGKSFGEELHGRNPKTYLETVRNVYKLPIMTEELAKPLVESAFGNSTTILSKLADIKQHGIHIPKVLSK